MTCSIADLQGSAAFTDYITNSLQSKLIEGMVRKPIVTSLLFAFDVEPVLTVHNVELVFIRT